MFPYIGNHINAQITKITYHVLILGRELRMREQFGKILLGDAVLNHHIEGYNAHLIIVGDSLHTPKQKRREEPAVNKGID